MTVRWGVESPFRDPLAISIRAECAVTARLRLASVMQVALRPHLEGVSQRRQGRYGGEILQSRLSVNFTLFPFNGLFGRQGAVPASRFSSAWPYQSWLFLLCPACLPFSYNLWNLVLSSGARSSYSPCCRKRRSTFHFEYGLKLSMF